MSKLQNKINIRLSNEQKEILSKAADINNLNLSAYILSVMIKQAEYDIKEHETIKVNNEAMKQLMNALSNPPKVNAKLRKLMQSKL